MTVEQIRNTIGSCVIGLTRHVMKRDALPHDEAYCKVFRSELFKLVSDSDTRLYLEPNVELSRLYDIEVDKGVQALYDTISDGCDGQGGDAA